MKKIKLSVYSISELNFKSKENAYNNWLSSMDYYYHNDNENTLNVFCDIFNVNCYDWEYGNCNFKYKFDIINLYNDEIAENIKGVRLYKYLQNNFKSLLDNKIDMTGYYMDNIILEYIFEFYNNFNSCNYVKYKNYSYYSLINDCLYNFFNSCNIDYDYCMSFDAFIEESSERKCLYLSDGKEVIYE